MTRSFPLTTQNLRERVLAVLSDELARPGEPLAVNVPIGDLGADSLDALNIQYRIAKALDISFSDDEDFTVDMTALQIIERVVAKVGAA
jgi:acyl carrier protein